jgi:hypothetical protein
MDLKRRKLLLAGGALALNPAPGCVLTPRVPEVLAQPTLGRLFGISQVCAIGAAYLRAQPEENDIARLLALITARAGNITGVADTVVQGRLQLQARGEFERGDTLTLEGWVLARTEARQSALCSLLYA